MILPRLASKCAFLRFLARWQSGDAADCKLSNGLEESNTYFFQSVYPSTNAQYVTGELSNLIGVNFWRPELNYIESVLNVDFYFGGDDITYQIVPDGHLDPFDGYTHWQALPNAQIEIEQSYSDHGRLFLHEMARAIGHLENRPNASVEETVMLPQVYRSDPVEFGSKDLIDLWAIWGVSRQYTGDIHGDERDNVLFGGTGVADTHDNSESIYGMAGNDTIYSNGGDDVIYGGSGIIDPQDGDDTIYGGIGMDTIYGNGGDDIIYDTTAVIYGGLGADTFYVTSADQVMDLTEIDTLILI